MIDLPWAPRRMRVGLLALTFCGVLAACGPSSSETSERSFTPPLPEVGVLTVAREDIVLNSNLPGRTMAYRVAEVRPQVSGIVLRRLFEEGAQVQAGQPLYEIDAASYRATHEQAEAALGQARANLQSLKKKAERYAHLLRMESMSQQEHDEAQSAYLQALANEKSAQAAARASAVELSRTRIVAPIAGRIGRSTVTEGALLTAAQTTALSSIQQLDPIYVDIVQSNQALLTLRRGIAEGKYEAASAHVQLRLEDGSLYEHVGTLKFSEVNVNPQTGAVTLRAQFPNPQGLLLPGMYVRVDVEQGVVRNGVLLPQQSMRYNKRGEAIALIVDAEHKVSERVLTVQGSRGDRWIVSAGLAQGDQVIVEGMQRVIPGDFVKPIILSTQALPATEP